MSPLIHAEVGWLIAQPLPRRRDRVVVTVASVIPDVDGLGLVVSEQLYADWHHRLAHGVIAAVVVTLAAAAVCSPRSRLAAAGLALLALHSHIAMDLCGSGPGWPIVYLWPFSETAWLPSWQWDLASWQNAVFGLAVTLSCVGAAAVLGRTPVELFSLRADARVVATVRARLKRPAAASSSSS